MTDRALVASATEPATRLGASRFDHGEVLEEMLSYLIHAEEAVLPTIPDHEPGLLDLQRARISELRDIHGKLVIRRYRKPDGRVG